MCLVLAITSCCETERKAVAPAKKAPAKEQSTQAKPASKAGSRASSAPSAPPASPELITPVSDKSTGEIPAAMPQTGQVAPGDSVSVLYKGTLNDGTVFDASERHNNKPLTFVVGKPGIIKGVSDGVIGMKLGEKKTLHTTPDDAYGPYYEEAIIRQPVAAFKQVPDLKVGMMIPMTNQQGQTLRFTVTKIEGDTVTLDANHPLAGKDLNFDIEVVKIDRSATPAAPTAPATPTE